LANKDTTSIEQLKGLEPLSTLSDERLEELLPLTEIKFLAIGQSLFREGDVDNQLVYLLNGDVRVHSSDDKLDTVISHKTREACFPLDDSQPHMMSGTALGKVIALYIDNSVLDYLMMWDQMAIEDSLMNSVENLLPEEAGQSEPLSFIDTITLHEPVSPSYHDLDTPEHQNWIRRMRQVMAFRNLPPANLRTLLDRMETVDVKAGDVIVKQGEQGDYYYVLTDGKARVTQSVELASLGGGDSFGEEALISGATRNATVIMQEDGQLMRLSKQDFNSLLKEPMLKRLSAEEAQQRIKQGACWLDVRYAREHHHQRLPGSINIPLHELRSRLEELDKSIHYICYCGTGRRSSAAAFLLSQKGFIASVLNGGIQILAGDKLSAGRPAKRPATEEV